MSKPQIDSDELSAFVASTLRAIAAGVKEASDQSSIENDGFVYNYDMPDKVTFDLAVTAKRSESKSGGLSVQIASIFAGEGKMSHEHGSEEISRIAFDVKWRAVDSVLKPSETAYDRNDELCDLTE